MPHKQLKEKNKLGVRMCWFSLCVWVKNIMVTPLLSHSWVVLKQNGDSPTDQFAPAVTAIDGEIAQGQTTQR